MMLTINWHGRGQGCASFLSSPIPKPNTRKKTKVIKLNTSTPSESNVKKENLSATRKETIKLPNYDHDCCGGKKFHISEFLAQPSGIQAMLNTNSLQSFQALDTSTYSLRVLRSWNDKTIIFQIYTPFTMMPVSPVERPGNFNITVMLTITWHGGQGCASFLSSPILKPNTRKKTKVIKLNISTPSESNVKKANLSAARKERIKLPNYDDNCCRGKTFHISEFLGHPSGIQAMLNTSSLQSFQALDTNTYRCFLPKVRLLNFEAAPVLELRVTPTNEDCTVEMLSCKFEGSEIMERQNNRFSAFMLNHMTWETNDFESFLEVDVKLNLTLEIYTRPFTMMPVSSVERPGNLMMQALLDRLFPLHLQQLLQDYDKWVHQQMDHIP